MKFLFSKAFLIFTMSLKTGLSMQYRIKSLDTKHALRNIALVIERFEFHHSEF